MEDTYNAEDIQTHDPESGLARVKRTALQSSLTVLEASLDSLHAHAQIIRKEIELFLGTALFLIGVFGFHADRFCDGNTADYLSCTRPSAYYYYSWFDITVIVLGAFLVLLWVFGKQATNKK